MDENSNNSNNYQQNPGSFSQPPGGYDTRPPFYQPEMTFKDWTITCMLLMIPCVGLIMLLIWAFSGDNETKSNFAKGYLVASIIWTVVGIVLSAIFYASIFAMIASAAGAYY